MIGAIFLLVLSVLLLYSYKVYFEKYKDIEKLPGPSIWDLINFYRQNSSEGNASVVYRINLANLGHFNAGVVTFLQSFNNKYGSIVKIWIKPFKPILMTTDMEFVEKVFKSNEFVYSPSFVEIKPLLRDGVPTTDSPEIWKQDKIIINRALTHNYISDRLTIYNRKYDDFMGMINENLEKAIDVEPALNRLQAEVIIESLNDPQIKTTFREVDKYITFRNKYMNLLLEKMNSKNMVGIVHKFTENYRSTLECAKTVIQISDEFLRRHENIPRHQRDKNNLIYAMMNSGMPRDRIVDNINSLITGGYETSVLPLSLVLYELGKKQDMQQKVLEEVLAVVGPTQSKKQITLNDVNDMTYLNCVIKESLRLFFPAPFVDRLTMKDVKIKNMTIPKGTQVFFNVPEILKSEENYQSANVFNPDRFLPGNIDTNAKRAFISFGFGLKSCPGKHLAMAAMKLLIAKIIREFQVCSVGDGHKVALKADVLYRSIDGIPVIFKKRVYRL